MSAIFGILSLDSAPPDRETLWRFGDALAHRGEGPPRLWAGADASLGCCHLAATPEAVGETMPFVHAASGVVVTADVRLDERADLIAALGLASSPGVPPTDGALLAEAYLKWGPNCAEHLLGDFAFGLWDPRERRFFAARDHFGVKPFYYVAESRRFAFATEPRALLGLPGVDREIDLTTLAVSLANLYDESDRTFYRAVRSLRHAETLVVTPGGGASTRRYYQPDPERRITLRSDAEYAEAFREKMFRAVGRRLRSPGPVGCMLSGGMDSSAVTSVAARIAATEPSTPRLETFSLVYPGRPECDETRHIQTVVRRFSLPWHPVAVDDHRTLDDARRLVERLQAPDVPLGAFANGSVCARAAAGGMRVLLDGHGGDETLSHGHERLRELLDDRRIVPLAYEYLRLAPTDPAMQGWRGLLRLLTNLGAAGRIKGRLRQIAGRWRGDGPPPATAGSPWPFLSEDLIWEADLVAREAAQKEGQTEARARRRWHHHIVTRTAQERVFANLHRLADTGTVELRYPMWDKDLVEFCLALPSRQKLRHGWTRAILRRALRGIVPPEILRRRDKVNFLPQATACLKNLDKNACKSLMTAHNAHGIAILQSGWLDATWERLRAGQPVTGLEQQTLWRGLTVAAWLEKLG